MAKAKRSGNSHKGYYAAYKTARRWEKNRRLKLERALRENPGNEEQIKKALSNIEYRRKKPLVKKWSSTTRRIAELFKKFQGKVPAIALVNYVPKSREEEETYWKQLNTTKEGFVEKAAKFSGSMFSIAARISS